MKILEWPAAQEGEGLYVWACLYSGVGRGDGSDLRVKVILNKELVFKCVCAKQEGCTVSIKWFVLDPPG